MAWGLEARVPFLDKSFLEVAMNIDAKYKMFSKGAHQQVDADGKPMMEKVSENILIQLALSSRSNPVHSAESFRLCPRREGVLARLDLVETERAVLGWCGILLD